MTEAKALKLLKLRSTEGLEWFIGQYTPYVSTVVHNIIGTHMCTADVEEVVADVFYILWNKSDSVVAGSVRGFLGCVARNKAKNKLREMSLEVSLEEEFLISEDLSLEEHCCEESVRSLVREAVMALTEPDKEIVLRYYFYFQSIAEISEQMGLSESNVKVRLHRSRNVLRLLLEPEVSG